MWEASIRRDDLALSHLHRCATGQPWLRLLSTHSGVSLFLLEYKSSTSLLFLPHRIAVQWDLSCCAWNTCTLTHMTPPHWLFPSLGALPSYINATYFSTSFFLSFSLYSFFLFFFSFFQASNRNFSILPSSQLTVAILLTSTPDLPPRVLGSSITYLLT